MAKGNEKDSCLTGARVIAQALHDLGVTVVHTLVGIPIADIAEEAIDLGLRVVGYRNEQACSYAASAYGYLTGKPGVCILTGGPGMVHGMAGVSSPSFSHSFILPFMHSMLRRVCMHFAEQVYTR